MMQQKMLVRHKHTSSIYYLCTVSTTSPATCPQLVTVLLKRPDPTHINEADFITTVSLLSIPQYDIVGDVPWQNRKSNCIECNIFTVFKRFRSSCPLTLDSASTFYNQFNIQRLVIHACTYKPLGLAGACHCNWMTSSRSPKRLQRGGATPHGLSSLVVTVVTSLKPRPKLFQPVTLYSQMVKGSRLESM